MKYLYQRLEPLARWRNVFIGLVLIIIINTVFFPLVDKKIKAHAPGAKPLLDLQFAYTPEEAYSCIESYGEDGRSEYLKSIFLVDTPYPVIYGITCSLLLILVLKKAFPQKRELYKWGVLPIAVSLLDIFENTGNVLLLANYPERNNILAMVTAVFTTLKWVLATVLILILIGLAVLLVLKLPPIKKSAR